jgi:hypothetical protein
MFWYGLTCLVLWMLLVMAAFALGRLSARGGRRPHCYQGYQAPVPYDQPGSPADHGPVTAAQILAERFARGEIGEYAADPPPPGGSEKPPKFSAKSSGLLAEVFFLLLEDQPAYLEVQLLGVGKEIDDAHRLIVSR